MSHLGGWLLQLQALEFHPGLGLGHLGLRLEEQPGIALAS